jgi:hypothetical protein
MRPTNILYMTNKYDKNNKGYLIKSYLKKEMIKFDQWYEENSV